MPPKLPPRTMSLYERIKQPFNVESAIANHNAEWPPEETPYYEWIDSNNILPPDLNEDIIIFVPTKHHHEMARSFVLL